MKAEQREKTIRDSAYINRELSWLEFNDRVLDEARDKKNPLLERVKFLSISCSNLDEFFMIRVASLKDMINAGYDKPDAAGLNPQEQVRAISSRAHAMYKRQYNTWCRTLLPLLKEHDIRMVEADGLSDIQKSWLEKYFQTAIYPILTPMAVDAARPFPLISSKSLNICVHIIRKANGGGITDPGFAIVQVPSVLPRLIRLPGDKAYEFIFLEDVIRMFLGHLFGNVQIGAASCFRIMRNADLDIDEEDAADLLTEIKNKLKQRQWGEIIRLEVESDISAQLRSNLVRSLAVDEADIYQAEGPLDLTCLKEIFNLGQYADLRFIPYEADPAVLPPADDIFTAIRQNDILLHHPYDSFEPVVEFVRRSARDPDVLAIKQTLYRVSGDSPIVGYLSEAAENGKQVMVLVELKARFDEENNINWARKLEKAGCHVIYGQVGLKTHSKIILVVRREEDKICRYVHLATGNYNDITAQLYSDFGLFTCSESIGADASAFFNMLSGYAAPLSWHKLVPAPFWLRREIERRIEQETRLARSGRPARIIAKINSLVDPGIIDHFYRASQCGVKVDLIVRGICCLRPGVPGLSENISVRSIIGRFLEHSRIYYFYNDGQEDIFLSSADLMPRNLDRRIELLFPVEEEATRKIIMSFLEIQMSDTVKARIMQPDGSYVRVDKRGKPLIDSQMVLLEQGKQIAGAEGLKQVYRFEPIVSQEGQEPDSE